MRFPLAALFFIISGFIFFVCWAVSSLLLTTVDDAITPYASNLSSASATSTIATISLLSSAFGILCVLFFIIGIVLIFVLDSWSDEPEMYWRR